MSGPLAALAVALPDLGLSFTARNVLLGATLLGAVGGVLGSFTLLRRQSLLGDALAHAALPGVCLGFLVTGAKAPLPLLLGALAAGLVGSLVIMAVVRGSRISEDSAIGIVLSVFFGLGIVLLTHIQHSAQGNQSGLDQFLFGQAAALVVEDLQVMAVFGGLALAGILLLYKELKVSTFDRAFAASLGMPVAALDVILTLLLVLVVVIGLQTVGVVLIVATLVTPAAAARQWTDRLGRMILLAAALGGGTGAAGALVSASAARLPTGPVIVLLSSAVLVVSLFLAPRRGLLWARLRERRAAAAIRRENLLKDLYRLGEGDRGERPQPVSLPRLMGLRGQGARELARSLGALERRGLVSAGPGSGTGAGPGAGAGADVDPSAPASLGGSPGGTIELSEEGWRQAASVVRKHRLWELYLTHRLELASDHVHRDAEAMEHVLEDEEVDHLDEVLGYPETDPHGRPIPRAPATSPGANEAPGGRP